MATITTSETRSPWRRASRYMALIAMLAGLLALLGWAIDEPLLKTMGPTFAAMKANTAIGLFIAGASLVALVPGDISTLARRFTRGGGLIVALLGFITFGEYRFGWESGIDELLFHEPHSAQVVFPGRMEFTATLCFVAIGLALAFLDYETRKGRRPAQFLSVGTIVVGLMSLIGYIYGVGPLRGPIGYSPMAVHTAVAFIALGCGILFARPSHGLMKPVTFTGTGGTLARQLVPLMLAIPLALGMVNLAAIRAGLYTSSFGSMVFVIAIILIFVTIVWFTSNALNRADDQRTEADVALHTANSLLRKGIDELQARNRETAEMNEMGDLLQSCQKAEEVHAVIGRYASRIFPNDIGCLFMRNQAQTYLESASSWGDVDGLTQMFTPDDCWALRRGRLHSVPINSGELVCAHVTVPRGESLCIPVAAQGQTLGLLHIQLLPASEEKSESVRSAEARRQLAMGIAERAALAVANLLLRDNLRDQSIRDPLTNMFNRRYAHEMLERDLKRAQRSKRPLSVIMVDIDHFKSFNDTYGHDAGDSVLKSVAGTLRVGVRSEDIACRYGGEEFLLVLPDASAEDAVKRGEELRRQVKSLELLHEGRRLDALSLSFGVACYPDHGSTWHEVVASADRALYEAKQQGRDRVVVATLPEAGLVSAVKRAADNLAAQVSEQSPDPENVG